jgi:hypothetical protein
MLLLALEPARVSATSAAQQEVRATVVASMEAVWTGKAFAPDLAQKQQKLRSMLETGLLTRAELESIIEQAVPILMNQHKTSRYYLQEISGRIDTLFASHITWEEIKKRVWKEMASIVKDGDQMVFRVGTLAPKGTPWLNVPEKC